MSLLHSIAATLGLQPPQCPSDTYIVRVLQRIQVEAAWRPAVLQLFPTAADIDFDWSMESDGEGGSYPEINWSYTRILDAEGNDLLDARNHEVVEQLQDLESDLGAPPTWMLSSGIRLTSPVIHVSRERVLLWLREWQDYFEQLPDDAFPQG